ncbi:protein of unknown function (plasmid) [Azospirillum baldaniorum]|uniref:Uncharacterized protein n=1 Tax=Azospirillum baldaniorum TaxID=1064539 RepID=A0A9P1JWL9_9PROT|nr:protein of unknown function [Azospirillum baldaniorum]
MEWTRSSSPPCRRHTGRSRDGATSIRKRRPGTCPKRVGRATNCPPIWPPNCGLSACCNRFARLRPANQLIFHDRAEFSSPCQKSACVFVGEALITPSTDAVAANEAPTGREYRDILALAAHSLKGMGAGCCGSPEGPRDLGNR